MAAPGAAILAQIEFKVCINDVLQAKGHIQY